MEQQKHNLIRLMKSGEMQNLALVGEMAMANAAIEEWVGEFMEDWATLQYYFYNNSHSLHEVLTDYFPHAFKVFELKEITTDKILELDTYSYMDFPKGIYHLEELKKIELIGTDYFRIKQLPDTFGLIPQLEELLLVRLRLEALPTTIGQLKTLKKLALVSNRITRLPESIGHLERLEQLIIVEYGLGQLPTSIGGLKALKLLAIDGYRGETLPESILELEQLEKLMITGAQKLIKLPDLRQLKRLKAVSFEGTNPKALEAQKVFIDSLIQLDAQNLGRDFF